MAIESFLQRWRIVIAAGLLILLAELIAGSGIVQRLFDPVDGSVSAARWRTMHAADAPTVLIVGDSRGVMDLSPNTIRRVLESYGLDVPLVVNAAIHGSSMEQSYLFLTEIVSARSFPDVVLLNVSEVALNDEAWHDNPPRYLRAVSMPLSLESWQTKQGRDALFEGLSSLVSLQQRFRPTIEGRWPNYVRKNEIYDWGGFRWHGQMATTELQRELEQYRNSYLADFSVEGQEGQYFEAILALAEAQNMQLLLVITPVREDFIAAFPKPDDVGAFRAYVRDQADMYGVPVADFYQPDFLPESAFFDAHHTNAAGNEVFSETVAKQLLLPALQDWAQFVDNHQSDLDTIPDLESK